MFHILGRCVKIPKARSTKPGMLQNRTQLGKKSQLGNYCTHIIFVTSEDGINNHSQPRVSDSYIKLKDIRTIDKGSHER